MSDISKERIVQWSCENKRDGCRSPFGCHCAEIEALQHRVRSEYNRGKQDGVRETREACAKRVFALGETVRKIKGAAWRGRVVGFYSTKLTPVGYAVESDNEPGSVQIYPKAALEAVLAKTSHDLEPIRSAKGDE